MTKKTFLAITTSCLLLAFQQFASGEVRVEPLLERGIAEYRAENYEEALELLLKAREELPSSSIAAFYLGLTYKQMGGYDKAAEAFQEAITLVPSVRDAYPELIEVLYLQNQLDEAKSWIARAEREGAMPASLFFLKGMILAKQGDYRGAIDAFTRAKQLDESLTQSAELQIALAQVGLKRYKAAMEHLKTVITLSPTSDLASYAKQYETALAQRRKMYKEWLFTIGTAYQYDDNVVLKPIGEIPGVEITGEEDSSAVGNCKIEYRPLLEGAWAFSAEYGFYGNIHSRTHSHDLMVHSVSLVPGYDFGTHGISLPIDYHHVWLRRHEYLGLLSVRPTVNMALGPKGHIGQLSLGYSFRDMLRPPLSDEEDRDGNIYSLSLGYFFPFLTDGGSLSLRYEFVGEDTEGKNWENTGHRFGAGILLPLWKRKINLIASGEAFLQYYNNEHTIFQKTRRDYTYSASAAINWEMSPGLILSLQYTYARDDSNILIYDYRRNIYTVGLEYRF